MNGNVITAKLRGTRDARTTPLWQYDYGQILRFSGVSLPNTYEVHFSNTKDRGTAKTSIGNTDGVSIPDEYLISGKSIFAWIYLHTGDNDGETEYRIEIPVIKRAMPNDDPPTPQEQSAITQAIAALDAAVVDVQEAVDAAESARASATSAAGSATAAAESEAGVQADADRASAAATAAESAQAAAETAQNAAETAQTGAETAQAATTQAAASQIDQINATGAAVLESIPQDYTELSGEVSDLKSALNNKVYHYFIWHDGQFVNTNGVISDNASRAYSDMIVCPAGTVCKYVGETANASINGISFYDKHGIYLSGIANNGTLGTECTVTAPSDSYYCRLTTRVTMKDDTYLNMSSEPISSTFLGVIGYIDIDSRYDFYKSMGKVDNIMTLPGAIDGSGGYYSVNTDYLSSDFIPVKKGDSIEYAICQYTTFSAIAIYDTGKNFVSRLLGLGTSTKLVGKFVANTDGYIRFSCYASSLYACRINFTGAISNHFTQKNVGTVENLHLGSSSISDTISNELVIWFPVTQGVQYTVDKKIKTNYYRLAYTTVKPADGVTVTDYTTLTSNLNYISFVAVKSGFAIMKIYDETTDTTSYEICKKSSVAYEGRYDSSVTQESAKLEKLDGLVFYCGGNRSLKTLKSGIEEATKYMDSTLYVDAGTFDLIEEFGSEWFEALDGTQTMIGLQLKNRVHVIFSPNSKVISHYTGNNQYAQSLYSPFNAGEYGFTLENLKLECSRCRYAIHDERNGGTEIYESHYINCNVYIDNSDNDYWSSRCSIGGGLGANAEVIIENCIWKSDNPDTSNARNAVYYHLSNSHTDSNHKAVVTIKDCFFVTGCVQLDPGYLSTSSENSVFVITNNSFPKQYTGADSQGVFHASLDLNTCDLYEWGNEIRGE